MFCEEDHEFHCVLRPSHTPLRGDYRRKSQETTEYKVDVFEN